MGTQLYTTNPHLKNAYSSNVKFDVPPNVKPEPPKRNIVLEMGNRCQRPTAWELDVRPLIDSKKWLRNYGLKKQKLTLGHILPVIGFKQQDDYDTSQMMKRPITSRYGYGLYSQLMKPDGKTFNITGNRQQLEQVQKRLRQAVLLYRRRLEWLTTESRRLFGVIEERAVTIVLDVRNMSPEGFDQYRAALETVLREQVSQISKFNLIRAAEDCDHYQEACVPVTHDTLEGACQWLWGLDRLAPLSHTDICEAVLLALADSNNEAVYLFTEGTSIDSSRELLKEKVTSEQVSVPLHVVSYNCGSSDTIRYLQTLAASLRGRFHAYAVVKELESYEAGGVNPVSSKANLVLKKRTWGGLPAGVGVREDVVSVFEEMEEARNILDQITGLLNTGNSRAVAKVVTNRASTPEEAAPQFTQMEKREDTVEPIRREECMGSAEWLRKFGLHTQKLGLYDVLSGVAFKHQDGVVDIMERPPDESQTNAVSKMKLVNARYCDQFPVVRWPDGRVVHVQVTPDIHRGYEQRMEVFLQKIQQRLDWLRQGSRELFGTVLEDEVYILLDCSASMQSSMQFVKDRLYLLFQEQLRHKKRFNLVSFNSKAVCWRDRAVEVNERNLQSAWSWVQALTCWGSTNTYAAISKALNDPATQAMYLLTDGRPDQPPKSVLAQVQMKTKVPIHTISFNCNDTEANRFLYELARTTCGRYHYFSEEGVDADQPESYESEDVQLLKEELKLCLDNLDQLARLRDECSSMAWRRHTDTLRRSDNLGRTSQEGSVTCGSKESLCHTAGQEVSERPESPASRPRSAPPQGRRSPPTARTSHSLATSQSAAVRSTPVLRRSYGKRPSTAKLSSRNLVASHTRTSLLRTLNSSARFSSNGGGDWHLPETMQLFHRQAQKHSDLQRVLVDLDLAPQLEVLTTGGGKGEKNKKKRDEKLNSLNVMSSKRWLKKHGLAAKRLTILDALSPTFVPHRSKYIPILDRHVTAKVFDQIMPLAHVTGRNKQEIRLVSPNAVDLDKYKKQVQQALDLYHKRLNQIVWDALSDATKEEYKSEGTVSFMDERDKLTAELESGGWNDVREEDVTLLVEEIERGMGYIQQASDLKAAYSGEVVNNDVEPPRKEYPALTRWDSRNHLEQIGVENCADKDPVSSPQ